MATRMDIEISAQELRQRASNMETAINYMKEALDTASNVMTRTSESFESSAANAFRGQYNQLKNKFGDFYKEMTNYATALRTIAASYEQADQEIEKAAQDVL